MYIKLQLAHQSMSLTFRVSVSRNGLCHSSKSKLVVVCHKYRLPTVS